MGPPAGSIGVRQPAGSTEGPETLRIKLLGGFSVSVGSRTIQQNAWRLRKSAALVKLLALAPRHRLHREQAVDALWPDTGKKTASNRLRRTLHAARTALDPAGGSHYLASENDSLVLCPGSSLWVDVDAFEEAAATARREREPAAYRAALDLYAGDLLPEDRYEDWAEERRQELRRMFLSLLVELATEHEERAEYGQGVEALRRAVAEEPTLEEAHAGLMRLYALLGQEAEALAQYERLRDALSKRLGTEPSSATNRLRDEITSGEFPSALSSPAVRVLSIKVNTKYISPEWISILMNVTERATRRWKSPRGVRLVGAADAPAPAAPALQRKRRRATYALLTLV